MNRSTYIQARWLCTLGALLAFPASVAGSEWTVQKASGQVWIVGQQAGTRLKQDKVLAPGELLQTGPNGRAFLVRNGETILVAPNSVISLPAHIDRPGMTTILQQAGSISVKANKQDVQHFEVQTPYLAAVVKGTEFVVTLEPEVGDVTVVSGEVEVTHFQSGQIADVRPGQRARSRGDHGLILSGAGVLHGIRTSAPVKAILHLIKVPKKGLSAPLHRSGHAVRRLAVNLHRSMHSAGRFAGKAVPNFFNDLFGSSKRPRR